MLLTFLILLGKITLGVLTVAFLYILSALLFSWIPKHRKFRNTPHGIEIYIISNGVHADFVLPVKHMAESWWNIIDANSFAMSKSEIEYFGFGWGDKGFYLDTPNWGELKLKTAVNAMLLPSSTLMHVKAFDQVPTDQKHMIKLTLDAWQFSKLCYYISNSFYQDKFMQSILLPRKGYTSNDNFYVAKGSYHAFNTCNNWVSKGLRLINVRTSLWTPHERGIFYQLKAFTPEKVRA